MTLANSAFSRRFSIGAEATVEGIHLRVWAPKRNRIAVLDQQGNELQLLAPEPGGYFSSFVPKLRVGDRYWLKVDEEAKWYPDPASRSQPEGPHGPSRVVSSDEFKWCHDSFRHGTEARVIYEMHVGTFTREGTYRAAMGELAALADLGVTMIELMPLNGFPGRFGWGYDGVNLWAPVEIYGSPDELRAFVDAAHSHGLGVILDVVYNHFGPDGNYLRAFSDDYFAKTHANEWGEAINFDGIGSSSVREFFRENARYWIECFHFDGLRLDATQAIADNSPTHVITEIVAAARAGGEHLGKPVFIVAENEPQNTRLVRAPGDGGQGVDALWNDDFHHSARVATTGRREFYYNDFFGTAQELLSALKWGYLFQGQHSRAQQRPRGTPALDLEANSFITYLQNHDQIANSATGQRLHTLTSPAELRAITALFLLAPPTPMLFQGQEFAASSPFLFFIDYHDELASAIQRERHKFLAQFPSAASAAVQRRLAEPTAEQSFEICKLNFSEREKNSHILALHRDLLTLRRSDPAIRQRSTQAVEGATLSDRALMLRIFCDAGDRLLITNLGSDLELHGPAEPLLAPLDGCSWTAVWSSEELKYGGQGYPNAHFNGSFFLPARSTVLLKPAVR